jgi:hypothetical protein
MFTRDRSSRHSVDMQSLGGSGESSYTYLELTKIVSGLFNKQPFQIDYVQVLGSFLNIVIQAYERIELFSNQYIVILEKFDVRIRKVIVLLSKV